MDSSTSQGDVLPPARLPGRGRGRGRGRINRAGRGGEATNVTAEKPSGRGRGGKGRKASSSDTMAGNTRYKSNHNPLADDSGVTDEV